MVGDGGRAKETEVVVVVAGSVIRVYFSLDVPDLIVCVCMPIARQSHSKRTMELPQANTKSV